jgi:hypothetical protein
LKLSTVSLKVLEKDVEIALSWNYDVNNAGCKFDDGGCFTKTKTH